ncbi:hypothetical protein J6590_074657 [Homalodisca vitripennis]|nr:hypothetical protein J6590_074657 [Homalodisca vitripennis]
MYLLSVRQSIYVRRASLEALSMSCRCTCSVYVSPYKRQESVLRSAIDVLSMYLLSKRYRCPVDVLAQCTSVHISVRRASLEALSMSSRCTCSVYVSPYKRQESVLRSAIDVLAQCTSVHISVRRASLEALSMSCRCTCSVYVSPYKRQESVLRSAIDVLSMYLLSVRQSI